MIGVLLNIGLFIFKFIGGTLSGSVSVTADAFNNLTDAGTMLLTALGVKIASSSPGNKHKNGHGRFEWIIALFTSTLVMLVAWELLRSSVTALKNPTDTVLQPFTVIVLVVSVGIKVFLYFYNNNKSKIDGSQALRAVAADSLSDAVSTGVVLISLVVNAVFSLKVDGICGIAVSVFIFVNGFKSFAETSQRIMGGPVDKELIQKLKEYVLSVPEIDKITDLRIEDYGYGRYGANIGIVFKKGTEYTYMLGCASQLRAEIKNKFGYIAFMQVENLVDCGHMAQCYTKLEKLFEDNPYKFKMRDFKVENGRDRQVIFFTARISFMNKDKEKDILEYINQKTKNLENDYIISANVETGRDFGISHNRKK